jgi:hypothetical protein
MGDRISIAFKNKGRTSVVLFSQHMGKTIQIKVNEYIHQLKQQLLTRLDNKRCCFPIDRLEPEIVMLDFIRWLTKNEQIIETDLFLGKHRNDGDNSNNGHWIYDLKNDKWIR